MAQEFNFDDIMKALVEDAEAVSTNLTIEDKSKITKAGAQVFADGLQKVTKQKHYRNRKTGENPHLADSIIVQNKNIDGMKDGNSTVGWSKEKAYVTRVINNGTRFPIYSKKGKKYRKGGQVAITADPFVNDFRESMESQRLVLEAEAEAYASIIKKREGI
ncbi:HK97 gp10 family phage protein [Lactococcus piscium]|uniref:HK97 gp10 family phage protein n=1 Tax=Pseudolactococcus paracarnosus TaxID=2749962 RepID=UPI001FB8A5D2|nr:HK97 gp10 family phage protein [Lactococcus paracarnosus]MCJ1993800.1 HK97 gp10 family phage protein [Lactococcus paracarnosus]